jgi:nitroimidazol reductase NimA-like FMN-containing flavoprotein (pyridoxamine 5'-phosphate oxidase superfamily)
MTPMNAATPQQRAARLIETAQHMTIATVDDAGRPWVSPVFFAPDDDYSLYWVSDPEALHSANLRARPEVAIVIHHGFDGRMDAVYITATAVELHDEADVRAGMAVMASRPHSEKWAIDDIAVVTDDGPWRIYKATRRSTQTRREFEKRGRTIAGREPADF